MIRRLSIGTALAVVIGFIIFYVIYTSPKHYVYQHEGIVYQLGVENSDYIEPVTISIDGTMQKSITGGRTFKGRIDVHEHDIPVPEDSRELVITFRESGLGDIIYHYVESGRPYLYTYGVLVTNDDLSELTILYYNREGELASGGKWTSDDGYMITAPADNRTDALEIADRLLADFVPHRLE